MKKYKAGDFTSGKMNEIFKVASNIYPVGAKINHKQLGDFTLIKDDSLTLLMDTILSSQFGIFKQDGKYVSCFGAPVGAEDDFESQFLDYEYFRGHTDNSAKSIMLSYEILNSIALSIDSGNDLTILDMIEILSLKNEKADNAFSLSITTDDKRILNMFGTKDEAYKALGLTQNAIELAYETMIEKFIDENELDVYMYGFHAIVNWSKIDFIEVVKRFFINHYSDIYSKTMVEAMVDNVDELTNKVFNMKDFYIGTSMNGEVVQFKRYVVAI